MEKNTRPVLMVLVAAGIIFLVSAVSLYFMRQAEIEKRVAIEKRLEETIREKARIAKELEETVFIKNDLEVRLAGIQEKANLLEGQLNQEKNLRETIENQFENEKRESRRFIDELMKTKAEKEEIALNLANVRSECEVLKAKLSGIQQAKEALEDKLKGELFKKEVELERIVVKPEAVPGEVASSEAKAGSPNELKGEVLVVNKKFDFVVVNLGENAGIRPGMSLNLYRDGKVLAMLEVEKVHANMAAAKIPSEAKDVDIREGDTVVVQ